MSTRAAPDVRRSSARAPRRDSLVNRERLLDAALVAVHRDGPQVPMAAIATEAGVGVGTLYRHFADRTALLDALSSRSFELVLANVRAAEAAASSGLDGLDRFIDTAIDQRDRLALPLGGGPGLTGEGTLALRAQVHARLQALVDRGRADGSVLAEVTAADVVLFGGMLAQPGRPGPTWTRASRRLKDVFVAGLAAGR